MRKEFLKCLNAALIRNPQSEKPLQAAFLRREHETHSVKPWSEGSSLRTPARGSPTLREEQGKEKIKKKNPRDRPIPPCTDRRRQSAKLEDLCRGSPASIPTRAKESRGQSLAGGLWG